MPRLDGIDHIHVYVRDRATAERWYRDVLGFTVLEKFRFWATDTGPLTLENEHGTVHLALFETSDKEPGSAIAFGATGAEFLAWQAHLESRGLELRITDHAAAFSLYFNDPDDNLHEITTYDHEYVREHVSR